MGKSVLKSALFFFLSFGLMHVASNEQLQAEPITSPNAIFFGTSPESCEIIEFDGDNRAEYVNDAVATIYSENTPVRVSAQLLNDKGQYEQNNTAMLFDTSMPNGNAKDFKTPSPAAIRPMGNVLTSGKLNGEHATIHENGSRVELDFSAMGSITLKGIHVLDITKDEAGSTVEMLDANGKVIKTMNLPVTGAYGATRLNTGNTPGVVKLRITFTSNTNKGGSGAIDVIEFCRS